MRQGLESHESPLSPEAGDSQKLPLLQSWDRGVRPLGPRMPLWRFSHLLSGHRTITKTSHHASTRGAAPAQRKSPDSRRALGCGQGCQQEVAQVRGLGCGRLERVHQDENKADTLPWNPGLIPTHSRGSWNPRKHSGSHCQGMLGLLMHVVGEKASN